MRVVVALFIVPLLAFAAQPSQPNRFDVRKQKQKQMNDIFDAKLKVLEATKTQAVSKWPILIKEIERDYEESHHELVVQNGLVYSYIDDLKTTQDFDAACKNVDNQLKRYADWQFSAQKCLVLFQTQQPGQTAQAASLQSSQTQQGNSSSSSAQSSTQQLQQSQVVQPRVIVTHSDITPESRFKIPRDARYNHLVPFILLFNRLIPKKNDPSSHLLQIMTKMGANEPITSELLGFIQNEIYFGNAGNGLSVPNVETIFSHFVEGLRFSFDTYDFRIGHSIQRFCTNDPNKFVTDDVGDVTVLSIPLKQGKQFSSLATYSFGSKYPKCPKAPCKGRTHQVHDRYNFPHSDLIAISLLREANGEFSGSPNYMPMIIPSQNFRLFRCKESKLIAFFEITKNKTLELWVRKAWWFRKDDPRTSIGLNQDGANGWLKISSSSIDEVDPDSELNGSPIYGEPCLLIYYNQHKENHI